MELKDPLEPWVKALAAKPEDLSSIPKTHMTEGKNDSPGLSSGLHINKWTQMNNQMIQGSHVFCQMKYAWKVSSLNEVYQYYLSDVVSSPGFDKLNTTYHIYFSFRDKRVQEAPPKFWIIKDACHPYDSCGGAGQAIGRKVYSFFPQSSPWLSEFCLWKPWRLKWKLLWVTKKQGLYVVPRDTGPFSGQNKIQAFGWVVMINLPWTSNCPALSRFDLFLIKTKRQLIK